MKLTLIPPSDSCATYALITIAPELAAITALALFIHHEFTTP